MAGRTSLPSGSRWTRTGPVLFNTGAGTVKGRSLRNDPRMAMCVDDERPPFAFVTLEGTAELSHNLDEVRHWATIIGGRYMGADRAVAYGSRNGVPGEMLVRLRVTHVTSARGIAD